MTHQVVAVGEDLEFARLGKLEVAQDMVLLGAKVRKSWLRIPS